MSITVTTRGSAVLDVNAMLDLAVTTAIGNIQRRTAKGIDLNGNAMEPYSELYALQLQSVGENAKVDLTRSGAYLASIKELSRTIDANGNGRATIGPGTGTSPVMPLPPPYVFSDAKSPAERAEAFARWKASPKAGGRSPPHNVLGSYLSEKRPHLGLLPDEAKRLAQQMVRVGVKQGR